MITYKEDNAVCFLLDYGLTKEVAISELRQLSSHADVPGFVLHCARGERLET